MFVTVPVLDQTDKRSNDQTLNTDHIVSIRHGRADVVGITMSNGDHHIVPLAPIMAFNQGKFEKLLAVLNGKPGDDLAFSPHVKMS